MKRELAHGAEHAAGWVLTFIAREAVRYPWPSAVAGLLLVIYVIRRLPSRRIAAGESSPAVIVPGVAIGAVVIAAAIGGVAWFMHQKPAVVAAAKPVITEKVVRPVVVQHITHVAASSHTGLYILIGVIAFLVIGMIVHSVNRLTGD